jgi:hypothetical protein
MWWDCQPKKLYVELRPQRLPRLGWAPLSLTRREKAKTSLSSQVVVVHAFNPSTWEAEAGGFLSWGQPGLQSEFQDSQDYTVKPCLKKPKKKKKKDQPEPRASWSGSTREAPDSLGLVEYLSFTQLWLWQWMSRRGAPLSLLGQCTAWVNSLQTQSQSPLGLILSGVVQCQVEKGPQREHTLPVPKLYKENLPRSLSWWGKTAGGQLEGGARH